MDVVKRKRKIFDPRLLGSLVYLDVTAAIHLAPISKRAFYQYIAEGKLSAFRAGGNGKLLVRREDLERFLTATPVETKLDAIVDDVMTEITK